MDTNLVVKTPEFDYSAIEHAPLADTTKNQYKKAINNYLATGAQVGDVQALGDYAADLPRSSRAFLKAAIKIMSKDFEIQLKAGATPANVDQVTAGLYRLEAVQETIKVEPQKGSQANIWLSQKQVLEIMATCEDDIVGQRDWIVLGLMFAAGLRRSELVELSFSDVYQVPRTNGNGHKMRSMLNIKGKGAKNRQVPISEALAERIRKWQHDAGAGKIARSLGRKKVIGDSLSTIGAFKIVRKRGKMIGIEDLAPHDCRRTYAQLGFDAGVPVTQISKLLGHADIATTQKYLNLDLDVDSTVSDFIPLE